MGFYGNITNVNNTTFVFDKIYPNRVTMDDNTYNDGIFIGRYVLVDYDEDDDISLYTRLYKRYSYDGDWTLDYFYFTYPENEIWNDEENRARFIDIPYYIYNEEIKEYQVNPERLKTEYIHHIFNGEIVYTLDESTGIRTFYKCTKAAENYGGAIEYAHFELMDEPADADIYYKNFQIDRKRYPMMGRGYDSTVWQKVYTNEQEKYVLVAELNSIVPTFGLTIDPPTLTPRQPHFDADSTNVYYRLHVQPSWGFRIAEEEEKHSDMRVSSYTPVWDSEMGNNKWQEERYDGAIFYNRQGLSSDARKVYPEEWQEDVIKVVPTGKSGQLYNTSHESGSFIQTEQPDILEMTFNLPSLGNAISDIWDIVYGTGDKDVEDDTLFHRNKLIDWDTTTGLRLVQELEDGSGFEYRVKEVNTLAGCINSVHDLMGMIITNNKKLSTETEEEYQERISLDNSVTNRIYFGAYGEDPTYKSFYIKHPTYKYIKATEPSIVPKPDLKDFNAKKYYIFDNNNYYLQLDGYDSGNHYYLLEDKITEVKLHYEDYEPGKFYYEDDGSYILSMEPHPDDNKTYYSIDPSFKEAVDSSQGQFFFPTDEEYYNKYFATSLEEIVVDGVTKSRGSGLFYSATDPENNNQIFKPFKVGETPYQTPLYWWINFILENSVDKDGNIVPVYDFEKDPDVRCIEYKMVQFEPNKYYYYNEETKDIIVLKSEKEIDISKPYQAFADPDKIKKIEYPFYRPNTYHYSEGNDYLLGKGDKIFAASTYYLIDKEIPKVTDEFYEPNKYHYSLNGRWILDDSENFTEGREYHKIYYLYVMEDTTKVLQKGAKWNENINSSDAPEGVTLGIREEIYEWKELPRFGKTLNTIHGLILEINKFLEFNNKLTRDTTTVQGCINTINDIIRNFGDLYAEQILIVDEYGRISSSPFTLEQEVKANKYSYNYDTETLKVEEAKVKFDMAGEETGWIHLDVNPSAETPMITLNHKFNSLDEEVYIETNLNDNGKDTIGISTPVVDNMGHVSGMGFEQITLPYGYKTIYANNTESVEKPATSIAIEGQSADNTQDKFTFNASNDWIKLDNNTKNTLQLGHKLSSAANSANTQFGLSMDLTVENLDENNIFNIPNFKFDEAGHIIEAETKSVTLPEAFSSVIVKSKFEDAAITTIQANSLQDDLAISAGNKWIEIPVDNEKDSIQIQHYSLPFSESVNTIDLNNEKEFKVQEISWDDAGHLISSQKTTFTLPYNFKTISVNNSGNTATTLNGSVISGELEAKTPIDNFTLDTGNKWIQFNSDTNAKTITISHGPAGEASVLQSENIIDNSPSFGGIIKVPYIDYDEAGHIKSSGIRTITLPSGELEKDEDGNVLIGLEFESSTGKISEIKENIGNLVLTGYTDNLDNSQINDSDTVVNAFSKLQNQIENLQIDIGGKSVAEQISQAIEAANLSQYALDSELAILTGRIGSVETKVTDEKIAQWDNAESNVQSNWDETDTTSDAYILNKPDIANLIERIAALEEKVQVLEGYHTTTDVPEEPVV